MRRVFLKRLVVALVVFGAVHVYVSREWRWPIALWIERMGEAAGCEMMRIGKTVYGRAGPFFGEGVKVDVWNFVWRHGPWVCAALGAYGAAAGAYWVVSVPLGGTRVFGYRGETRCGGCGYGMRGLREMRCPECGRGCRYPRSPR